MKFPFRAAVKSALALCLAGLVCAGLYYAYQRIPLLIEELVGKPDRPSVPAGRTVIVDIPKGAGVSQVGTILKDNSIISSPLVFKLVAVIRGEQRKIQAGEYELKTGSDPGDVLDLLISGKTRVFPFTVPEGYNIFQIADLFQQSGKMERDEFLRLVRDKEFISECGVDANTLEGYLFPDTYFLKPSERADGKLLIRRMVKRFQDVYDSQVRAVAEEHGWTMHQVVTLASLVEKEAKKSEHALVSAVFHNRLRKKMKLQSDPTVIYGVKPMGSPITRADLLSKHSYNTYQVEGLPPGPIANPGKDSLIAAVNPADVDYLYFVAKNDGAHQFSTSLQEHNRYVNMYQRRPREVSQ
jgi:UPF0755 protein